MTLQIKKKTEHNICFISEDKYLIIVFKLDYEKYI